MVANNRADGNATANAAPHANHGDDRQKCHTTMTSMGREIPKDNTVTNASVGAEAIAIPTLPGVRKLVGGNATISTPPNGGSSDT